MIRARLQNARGFTLVELLIGASLSAAIMAAVLSTYIYLGRSLGRLANQQNLETEGRRALGYLTADVQLATGVTINPMTAPDFSVTFTVPLTSTGATQVTYCYRRDEPAVNVTIAGTTVAVPPHTLIRVTATATALVGAPQVLLRNIVTDDDGCHLRFYDVAGQPYDNGTPPFTPLADYRAGIKQVALGFKTQIGTATSATRTPVYAVASSRLVLRNRSVLP